MLSKKKHLVGYTLAVVATLVLATGCSSATPTPAASVQAGSNAATADAEAGPTPSETTTDEPSETKFGGSYTWEDGLQVTISAPKKYTPSESAAGGGKNNLVFTVTIVNKTGKRFDPSIFNTSLQSANAEAEAIFDSGNGIDGAPPTTLLNGREAKFKIAYSVLNPKDLVLEVTPSFEHNAAIFTS